MIIKSQLKLGKLADTDLEFCVAERKRSGDSEVANEDAAQRSNEEHWNLRDVIFVEDVRNVPLGKVLKVNSSFLARI